MGPGEDTPRIAGPDEANGDVPTGAGGRGRTGRRPGNPDTRAHILEVALRLFTMQGYDATSVRAVAREAGVDPALVHRFFGDKKGLLLAALQMGIDPAKMIDLVVQDGVENVGARLVHVVTGVWESVLGPEWLASIRRNPAVVPVMVRFMNPLVIQAATSSLGMPRPEAELRAALVETVVSGLAMTRYIAEVEPLPALTHDEVVRIMGPILQYVITGDLGVKPARRGPG